MTATLVSKNDVDPSLLSQGMKNVIIGGDFGTNPWQRGVSFASATNGLYSADRWQYGISGAAVVTLSRVADAPTVAQANYYTDACFDIQVTTVDSSIAASDSCVITNNVEGYSFRSLAQRAMVLSFWVKAYKTGIYCVSLTNSATDRTYVAEYTISQSGTWEKKVILVPASPSAGTWNYTNGCGLRVRFALSAGSTYQTTAGIWQTGNYLATSNQVNATDSTSNYFRLALVQLEAGSTATPFENRHWAQELALCQRYYFTTNDTSGRQYQVASPGTDTNQLPGPRWPVPMRATPTISISSIRDAAANAVSLSGIYIDFGTYGITVIVFPSSPLSNRQYYMSLTAFADF